MIGLTTKELEILELAARGQEPYEVAKTLGVSVEEVNMGLRKARRRAILRFTLSQIRMDMNGN